MIKEQRHYDALFMIKIHTEIDYAANVVFFYSKTTFCFYYQLQKLQFC